ncbi:MAG: hypothetical protein QXD03_02670 [Candidatus Anstonellales archaeon]
MRKRGVLLLDLVIALAILIITINIFAIGIVNYNNIKLKSEKAIKVLNDVNGVVSSEWSSLNDDRVSISNTIYGTYKLEFIEGRYKFVIEK